MRRDRYRRNESPRALLIAVKLLWGIGAALSPSLLHAQVQQPSATVLPVSRRATPGATPLVFDSVTVIDVHTGRLLSGQRVVVAGPRIHAVGKVRGVQLPAGAQVIDARGKYLIPGLWDMHVHVMTESPQRYAVFLAAGITGVRSMSTAHLDSALRWRRRVAAGEQVGPRVVVPGPLVMYKGSAPDDQGGHSFGVSIRNPDEARHVVDSLKAAGADFIKVRDNYAYLPDHPGDDSGDMPPAVYFALAGEARRVGIPFAGHQPRYVSLGDASDSGQQSFEHTPVRPAWAGGPHVADACLGSQDSVPVHVCQALAAKMIRNGSWFTPTLSFSLWGKHSDTPHPDSWYVRRLQQFRFPLLAGTDVVLQGDSLDATKAGRLHDELALYVLAGLTPLEALQAATLNPAKYLHATDSLGTIAQGKLADLVLLDANPLADIHNTASVRAVVANGWYLDRPALDTLHQSGDSLSRTPTGSAP